MRPYTVYVAIVLIIILVLAGCRVEQKTQLSDMQIEACNAADNAGTCSTRLAEVGIVLKEDCCKVLGKCC
ncbi:MAG: hypothetical protein V1702_05440 [Candidatus Woesearchaeota archaeon]